MPENAAEVKNKDLPPGKLPDFDDVDIPDIGEIDPLELRLAKCQEALKTAPIPEANLFLPSIQAAIIQQRKIDDRAYQDLYTALKLKKPFNFYRACRGQSAEWPSEYLFGESHVLGLYTLSPKESDELYLSRTRRIFTLLSGVYQQRRKESNRNVSCDFPRRHQLGSSGVRPGRVCVFKEK